MKKFAITGNIAGGKSVASELIKAEGYSVIDCDDIIKELYQDNSFIMKVQNEFPELVSNEKINKNILSEKLFSDSNFKQKYEGFVFPVVKTKIKEFFNQNEKEGCVFVVVPLLFEAGFESLFDKVVFIQSDEDIRRTRLLSRKSMLSDYADKVIASQQKEAVKVSKSDYVIKNNATLEDFKCSIIEFLKDI